MNRAMRFGEFLVSHGMVEQSALDEALEVQRFQKKRIGRMLRDLGRIRTDDLDQCLAQFYRGHSVDGSLREIAEGIRTDLKLGYLTPIFRKWAQSYGCEVMIKERATSVFLFTPRLRDHGIEEVESLTGLECFPILMNEDGIGIIRSEIGDSDERSRPKLLSVDPDRTNGSDDKRAAGNTPYTRLFRETLLAAKDLQASDIHFQPTRVGLDIRFRVHGDLITWKQIDGIHRRPFINEVKGLVNLSIAVRGKNQDARASFQDWRLDVRASLLPSEYDEKIVLRLLPMDREFKLEKSGLASHVCQELRAALNYSNGLIVVSGPTGSGKTTTLYTLLCEVDRVRRNVLTLEDPIEYSIAGLTQVQVGRKLSFADALRATLRQDPDVILVGEVRDAETADLCVKAASTGHLVLTTIHANGAKEVMDRFIQLGVDPKVLKSVLRLSSGQRLAKRLCPNCKRPAPEGERSKVLKRLMEASIPVHAARGAQFFSRNVNGCPQCSGGIVGRVPVLEYLKAEEIAEHLTLSATETGRTAQEAPKAGRTFQEACLDLAWKGEIDFHEIFQIS